MDGHFCREIHTPQKVSKRVFLAQLFDQIPSIIAYVHTKEQVRNQGTVPKLGKEPFGLIGTLGGVKVKKVGIDISMTELEGHIFLASSQRVKFPIN